MPVLAVAVGVGAGGGAQQGRSGQGEEQQALHWVVGACGQGRTGDDGFLDLTALGDISQFWDLFLGVRGGSGGW